jgi:hypothetical protein
MLALLSAGSARGGDRAGGAGRLKVLLDNAPDLSGGRIAGDYIDLLTSARSAQMDSLHARLDGAIFELIESAQRRWRMVNAPHLVALVRARSDLR